MKTILLAIVFVLCATAAFAGSPQLPKEFVRSWCATVPNGDLAGQFTNEYDCTPENKLFITQQKLEGLGAISCDFVSVKNTWDPTEAASTHTMGTRVLFITAKCWDEETPIIKTFSMHIYKQGYLEIEFFDEKDCNTNLTRFCLDEKTCRNYTLLSCRKGQ